MLVWAKDYINKLQVDTNYKLGTKRVFIPHRIPETIIEEFRNLGFEIIRDGITIMGSYIGTSDYMNQMLQKETNDIMKLIEDIKRLTIPDDNGCISKWGVHLFTSYQPT